MMVEPCSDPNDSGWLGLRQQLWPGCTQAEHQQEMRAWCSDPRRYACFVARDQAGLVVGFAEVSIRSDYVNGTETSPAGFLEGIHVNSGSRRQGVAAALVAAVEHWVRERGCQEIGSDADIGNVISQSMHLALGFTERERIVCYAKKIV